MDTTAKFEAVERFDTDVSFRLTFDKARERTPANRDEFEPINVALVADKWTYTTANRRAGNVSPVGQKYYEQLKVVLDGPTAVMRHGQKRAPLKDWLQRAITIGLIDGGAKDNNRRARFSHYKLELIAANMVACDEDLAWVIS